LTRASGNPHRGVAVRSRSLPSPARMLCLASSSLQEHVDTVQPRVAERLAAGVVEAAAEVGVPEVVEERQRRRVGGEGAGAADGDGDRHAQELAPLDGRAHAGGRVAR
jgi:hypothetical protein